MTKGQPIKIAAAEICWGPDAALRVESQNHHIGMSSIGSKSVATSFGQKFRLTDEPYRAAALPAQGVAMKL